MQINEKNHEKLNDIYVVLDKHIKTLNINIMFESDLGREEEEEEEEEEYDYSY
ncbi:hypothetical protein [Psychrilyobacter atlanticus]|uniref:hypothetical protein n=1 Tax=Psychrilyobacter atlanticus TaxID=271091 RepID=UPI000416648B|nr:hypothetical protein [Psychrilyobacter atlanticus]